MSAPETVLLRVADSIEDLPSSSVRRVAVDGVDGAGKTTFATALGKILTDRGASVISATVDGFHRPRDQRYRLGRGSPEGFYRESYDYSALVGELLAPLGPLGDGRYRTAVWDVSKDAPVREVQRSARPGDILLLDGIFLHRPELRGHWDLSVFLDVPFTASYARMARRDGSPPDPEHPVNRRYRDGQLLYLAEVDPVSSATIVIDYADFSDPIISRG